MHDNAFSAFTAVGILTSYDRACLIAINPAIMIDTFAGRFVVSIKDADGIIRTGILTGDKWNATSVREGIILTADTFVTIIIVVTIFSERVAFVRVGTLIDIYVIHIS